MCDEYKKCMYFLFEIVLFIVNYHECYFVFIEFEYYMKLFVWLMKTMVSPPPPSPDGNSPGGGGGGGGGAIQFSSAYIL